MLRPKTGEALYDNMNTDARSTEPCRSGFSRE